MRMSEKGIELLTSFEGCVLHAYKAHEAEKFYTIGYGHYGSDVPANMEITQEQAIELLRKDLKEREFFVNREVEVHLTQNQFDALVSFVYNRGGGNFRKSRLLKEINKENYKGASKAFEDPENWCFKKYSDDVKRGLLNRRKRERARFDTPDEVDETDWEVNRGQRFLEVY